MTYLDKDLEEEYWRLGKRIGGGVHPSEEFVVLKQRYELIKEQEKRDMIKAIKNSESQSTYFKFEDY